MQNVKFVFNVSESLYGPKCVCVRGRSHKRRGDDVDTSSCRDSKSTDTAREAHPTAERVASIPPRGQ